jgi:hypothetical protein
VGPGSKDEQRGGKYGSQKKVRRPQDFADAIVLLAVVSVVLLTIVLCSAPLFWWAGEFGLYPAFTIHEVLACGEYRNILIVKPPAAGMENIRFVDHLLAGK